MLLTIAGAVAVATAIVVAAHAARERRALGAEVRALRGELREMAARGPLRPSGDDHIGPRPLDDDEAEADGDEVALDDEATASAAGRGEAASAALGARGSRTLH